MGMKFDFSGWATKNDILCSDGRRIRRNAFKDNDGQVVPLVWMHSHNNPDNVLGHALLENRDEGVYAYCTLNDTYNGKNARMLVEHGDVCSLSIYANQLKQNGGDVIHGNIRELSLVLAGANPGATIDFPLLEHSDEFDFNEAIIYSDDDAADIICHGLDDEDDEDDEYYDDDEDDDSEEYEDEDDEEESDEEHDDEGDPEDEDDYEEYSEDDEDYDEDDEDDEVAHSDFKENGKMAKTVADIFNELTEEQKDVVYYMIGAAAGGEGGSSSMEQDAFGEDYDMKYNIFDGPEANDEPVLSHADMEEILADAKRCGSLKEAFLAHTADYGIDSIDWLFPEAHNMDVPPEFIKRDMGWVQKVMNATHHTPFSRIKTMQADITADAARAKGYLKGHKKTEEVFTLLKRTTDPQTIYKKQKLDRDDVIDITDFDVVSWLKTEMRMMLDEEIARAILIGDGRLSSSEDKINELHIRSIWNDDVLYAPKYAVDTSTNKPKALIKSIIKNRKEYKGSGNPTMFTTEDMLADMLLIEDGIGHFLYPTVDALATVLRVKEIITVPVMEEITTPRHDVDSNKDYMPLAIIVNLTDYNVGADKGGAVNMFDDFDIDYNQQKYLIETRCSGALIKPKSAQIFEEEYTNF